MVSLNPFYKSGSVLVEIIIAIALMAVIAPTIVDGLITTRQGEPQQNQHVSALALLKETQESLRLVREKGWNNISTNGTFHPHLSGNTWTLLSGTETIGDYSRSLVISDVYRDTLGNIGSSGTVDPSTKKATLNIDWQIPRSSNVNTVLYFTRFLDNFAYTHTSQADFNIGTTLGTQVINSAGGEVILANNGYAKWCSPSLSNATIDLPDGPPVAVAATASATTNTIPNDVFVAVSPQTSNSIKLAYLTVSANTDTPTPELKGTFTLDSTKYSNSTYVPTGIGLDNNFKTNDVKYYKSSGISDTNFLSPTANAAESGGDNNGFQTNPTYAYSNDSSFAVDTNSGNNTNTGCDNTGKDRHQFYNYGFNIPVDVTINGIEVRLDAKVDSTTGSPKMCVQLSWDGGTTWTSAKSTSTLSTGESTYLLGGSNDNWDRTWVNSNFTNANFRVRVINVASNNNRDFSLDWVSVKAYYNTGINKTYALLATNLPDKEVIAVLIDDDDSSNDSGTSGEYADPVNKIYKYHTFFNTRIYQGVGTQDQTPFGYGGVSLAVFEDRGYLASGGYLYVFDLSNIDSKTTVNGLDMLGCRVELDGYECLPGSGIDRKYSSGETGTSWSSTANPAHNDCSDGGNIELYANNDIYPVKVGSNYYVYVAVGAGVNPEFSIVNVTSIPNSGSSPSISNNSCGRITGGNSSWKRISSLDFNTQSGTEEAANSVYANIDGSRAYISSNGGIDANNDGQPDSYQLYVINTSNKSSPSFMSGTGTPPTSGYYYGSGANTELFPRRSLTVLNGQRAILVGKDSINNGNDAHEYQVLNISTETTPNFCGSVNFDQGFNDLTSVSEADGDNFVYMVANTNEKQLKIIQGGPDVGIYVSEGTFESPVFDTTNSTAINRFNATINNPAQTSISLQVAVANAVDGSCTNALYTFIGPDSSDYPGSYFLPSGNTISGPVPLTNYQNYSNPGRCIKYKSYFSTLDNSYTPSLLDITVNYSP